MKGTRKNLNSQLLEIVGAKPVVFNRALAQLANSAGAGLFLSQLLYWDGKGAWEGWVYKTIKDFHKEIHLNRSEQDRAIKIWKKLGVLEVKRKGIPCKRYFRIHADQLVKLLERIKQPSSLQNSANQFAENDQQVRAFEHTTTESTTKNTNKNSVIQTGALPKELRDGRDELVKKFSIPKNYHG